MIGIDILAHMRYSVKHGIGKTILIGEGHTVFPTVTETALPKPKRIDE